MRIRIKKSLKQSRDGREAILAQKLHDVVDGARLAAEVDMSGHDIGQVFFKQVGPGGSEMFFGVKVGAPQDFAVLTNRHSLNFRQACGQFSGRRFPTHITPPN